METPSLIVAWIAEGTGRIPVDRRSWKSRFPAGIHDGQAVRISSEGEPPPQETDPGGTGPRGDLHVVTRVESHQQFERDGNHLLLVMPAAFTQLALGAEVELPGLGEAEVHELHIPSGNPARRIVSHQWRWSAGSSNKYSRRFRSPLFT